MRVRVKQFLHAIATDRNGSFWAAPIRGLLWLASFVYCAGQKMILLVYQSGVVKPLKLPLPVISVGNITLGGVGKTPLVMRLAGHLRDQGRRPVILVRGYMASRGSASSDEVLLMEKKLPGVPVRAGRDRVRSALDALRKREGDVFLLDDGFQHWPLARDLDIVAVDCRQEFGNGHLLPRGILREPVNALKRADLFVLTKADVPTERRAMVRRRLAAVNPRAPVITSYHKAAGLKSLGEKDPLSLDSIKGRRVFAFCSIGDPDSFRRMILGLGGEIAVLHDFIDHHVYNARDVEMLISRAEYARSDLLMTTEKDEVKLTGFAKELRRRIPAVVLQVDIEIEEGEEVLNETLDAVMKKKDPADTQ